MTTAAGKTDGIGKDIVVYVCLLALAGLQFLLAYQNVDATKMMWRMLGVAVIEAGLAVMFFMHLGTEKRGFAIFVLVFTISVLLTMQYGWTDSTRMVIGAPFSK
jgi:heme/copper-type cytochrome/quinol oxidase subunit 4